MLEFRTAIEKFSMPLGMAANTVIRGNIVFSRTQSQALNMESDRTFTYRRELRRTYWNWRNKPVQSAIAAYSDRETGLYRAINKYMGSTGSSQEYIPPSGEAISYPPIPSVSNPLSTCTVIGRVLQFPAGLYSHILPSDLQWYKTTIGI